MASTKPSRFASPRTSKPKLAPPLFGAHMSIAGGLYKAAVAAASYQMATVQVFTHSPSQWSVPVQKPVASGELEKCHLGIDPGNDGRVLTGIEAFRLAISGAKLSMPVAHNSYLINLASPDDVLRSRSIESMVAEIIECDALGIGELVAHPGAHMGLGEEEGLVRIAEALDEIHTRTRGATVRIDLETTAGQGSTLGHKFEHLGRILQLVKEPERLGICGDTCHIFAAGYSLSPKSEYDKTIDALEREVGKDRVRVWHLNDSLRERGSRVDRHAGIGLGHLGLEPFRYLVNDPRFRGIPLILETPKGQDESGNDLDATNLRALRELVA